MRRTRRSLVSLGRQYVDTAWWLATFPGLAILLTALSANVLGDLLRDGWAPTAGPAAAGEGRA